MVSAIKIEILKDSFRKIDYCNKRIIYREDEQEKKEEIKLKKEAEQSEIHVKEFQKTISSETKTRLDESQNIIVPITSKLELLPTTEFLQQVEKSKQAIIADALKFASETLQAQCSAIFLMSKDGILKREGIYGFDRNNREIDKDWFSEESYIAKESFFTGKAAYPSENTKYGEIQYINDPKDFEVTNENKYNQENNNLRQYREKLGDLKCGISIPISGRYKTYGVLRIINHVADRNGTELILDDFSIEDRQFVLSLSALSTSIDSRLSNFRRDEQTRLLGKVSKLLIQSTSESKDIYDQILYLLVNHPETAFKGAILRVKQEDNSFQLVAKSFFEGVIGARDDRDRKPDEKSFLSLVIAEKQRLILQDVQLLIQDNNMQSNPNPFKNEQWIRDNKFQSFACFPLIAEGDEVQGTLSLYTGYNYEFHPDSVRFLQRISDRLAAFMFRLNPEKIEQSIQNRSTPVYPDRDRELDDHPKLKDEFDALLEWRLEAKFDALLEGRLEAKFNTLLEEWKSDTKTVLFMTQRCVHPAYQKIIGMGSNIVPLLLKKLSEPSGEDWFWALSAITGADPVKQEHRGYMDKVTEDWLTWGKNNSYEC